MFNYNSEEIKNPYAAREIYENNEEWIEGTISVSFLQDNFGQYSTATEMKSNTEDEGLKLFFDYLVSKGEIQE